VHRLVILFVDSDPDVHARMQQALGCEFVVLCVNSIDEAKACLNKNLPDVLISEIELGGSESGLALCRYIRERPDLRSLPIMLLTSLSTLKDKVAGFDAGTDDYVVKPFDAHHLQARIRLLARIKRLERRLYV
jgi:DNA-binding response OmpR family regulator